MALDPTQPYELHSQVALRPEPFGALAYHYGNRRLTFLKSAEMVELVSQLEHFSSVDAALESLSIPQNRRDAYIRSLVALEASEVIHAR